MLHQLGSICSCNYYPLAYEKKALCPCNFILAILYDHLASPIKSGFEALFEWKRRGN